jgi:hypothetical protein
MLVGQVVGKHEGGEPIVAHPQPHVHQVIRGQRAVIEIDVGLLICCTSLQRI